MLNVLISLGVFVSVLLCIQAGQALMVLLGPEQRRFHRRLHRSIAQKREHSLQLVKNTLGGTFPKLDRLLARLFPVLQRLPEQANVWISPGKLVSYALLFGIAGLLGGLLADAGGFILFCAPLIMCSLPFLYVLRKRRARRVKFERQFPNAMDLVARSMRAGHPFLAGLRIVSEEMEDPVGLEFRKTVEEIVFGIETEQALKNLSQRIDSLDLKFFVTAAVIQRETGGNLAEIVEAISEVIRRRFEMQSKTRSLAAEGKLSAGVLIALPILLLITLSILNPDYIHPLFHDPAGQRFLQAGAILMILGALIMKKMVAIKV